VKATHRYDDAEEYLKLKEDKHGDHQYIDPKHYNIDLGNERKCLEAFDLL